MIIFYVQLSLIIFDRFFGLFHDIVTDRLHSVTSSQGFHFNLHCSFPPLTTSARHLTLYNLHLVTCLKHYRPVLKLHFHTFKEPEASSFETLDVQRSIEQFHRLQLCARTATVFRNQTVIAYHCINSVTLRTPVK